jgi:hypothetical protein
MRNIDGLAANEQLPSPTMAVGSRAPCSSDIAAVDRTTPPSHTTRDVALTVVGACRTLGRGRGVGC